MTIINPNSISGITSFTAEADVMNFYRSNGTLGSLQLNGCNFYTPTGISTFNNLIVGGTLTYEDVKNVDSVGIISARTAIHVGAGISAVGIITGTSFDGNLNATQLSSGTVPTARLGSGTANNSVFLRGDSSWAAVTQTTINNNADNRIITGSGTANTLEGEATLTYDGTNLDLGDGKYVRLGASNDFQMWHNGGTGNTNIKQVSGMMYFYTGSDLSMLIRDGTSVDLYYANSKKFETTSSGITVTGTAVVSDISVAGTIYHTGDTDNKIEFGTDSIILKTGNSNRLETNNYGVYVQSGLPLAFLATSGDTPNIKSGGSNNRDLLFTTGNAERLRIDSSGRVNIGTASQSQGQLGILNTNDFSTASVSTNTDNIWLISDATSGDGVYGASIGFSRVQYSDRRAAAIATVQEGTDEDHVGLAFFTHPSASATDPVVEKLRIAPSGLVKVTNDLIVNGTVYGGNGGRRNWLDNGDMTIVSRYINCQFAGNYHSYGWVTDRYQNRGTNAQWSQDTNVPAGKGFIYSAKVNSGTGGTLSQSIELTRKGQHGMFANDTYWCVSLWSTQPINRASNNGFCKDLGSSDYTAFDNVTPSSGNAYQETGETASGTSTGTFKRYYHVFQAPNSLSSNAFAVNFGWSINYSGSGGCYLTGFQCEQVPNANCKPTPYEHVDGATQLKRCQRYAFRQSDNSSATGQNPGYTRLINGYKRHDDDVHFNFFCPVPMTPYNNSSPPQGLTAWDVGTCTNMGGNLGGTVSNVRLAEMNWDTGWCMILFDYSAGGTNVIIPSWEGFSFEVGGSHF